METSQKNLCTKTTTPKESTKNSKAIVHLYRPCKTYTFVFRTKKINLYLSQDTRSSGTLYNTKVARYFLLNLNVFVDRYLPNEAPFIVCTNDTMMTKDHQRIFNSTSQYINIDYLIGTYLTFTFAINHQFSQGTVNKYFKRLRQLLKDKLVAIKNRLSSTFTKKLTNQNFYPVQFWDPRDLPGILFRM